MRTANDPVLLLWLTCHCFAFEQPCLSPAEVQAVLDAWQVGILRCSPPISISLKYRRPYLMLHQFSSHCFPNRPSFNQLDQINRYIIFWTLPLTFMWFTLLFFNYFIFSFITGAPKWGFIVLAYWSSWCSSQPQRWFKLKHSAAIKCYGCAYGHIADRLVRQKSVLCTWNRVPYGNVN